MEGLRPAFAGRIGLLASSGGTLEKADVLGPGRAGHRAVGAEGGWGGTNFLHNPWPLKMQSECHGRTPRTDPQNRYASPMLAARSDRFDSETT